MLNIQPKFIKFADLLEKRLFRIPHYQRAYSWRRAERQDMFKDIQKLKDRPGSSHFMATVVGLRRDTVPIVTDEYDVIEIVDGQQRLTTLVILLKVIAQELEASLTDDDKAALTTEARLERELQELLVKQDELSLILLQTNHDRSQHFANFLRDGTSPPISEAQTLADRELLRAIHECKSFVKKWGDPTELLRLLKNQLYFIFHETHDEEAVYTVFEVLNNRGLEVSWLAKLKSRLMEVVFETDQGNNSEYIDELHRIWGSFYGIVGLREGVDTEALTFAATLRSLRVSRILGDGDAVERLMKEVDTNVAKTIKISSWLLKVVNAVNRLQEEMRQPVTKIRQARLLAVSIMLRDFPAEVERKLLDQWETTSFRIFGLCRKDARTGVGDFVRLACEVQNNLDLSSDDISERIREIGAAYTIDEVRDQLWEANCYNGWEAELRYVLCRYEEHLAKQRGQTFDNEQWNRIWQESAANSIEHILPQSNSQNGILVHRLGNLLLLPPRLNSSLRDKDPRKKADDYRQTGLLIAGDVAATIQERGWGEAEIEGREDEITSWIYGEFVS